MGTLLHHFAANSLMTSTAVEPDLSQHRQTDDRLAPIMFGLATVFLGLLAGLIVTRVDIPRVIELSALESETSAITATAAANLQAAEKLGKQLFSLLLLLWPLFIAESIFHIVKAKAVNASRRQLALRAASALIPPLRLGTPSTVWDGRVWLPFMSWVHPGKFATGKLARFFGRPMIAIALLILPILLLEFGLKSLVANHAWLRMLIHVATGFIWFAFTVEFILMVSVTDKKLRYIKKNWLDLAIILLPLISFLRGIRVLRLAKLAKVSKLAKMGRIYRMRGLGMKLFRALLLFEVVNRVLRITPEKQLEKLEAQREEHLVELEEMDTEIGELKAMIDTQSKHNKPDENPSKAA